MKTADAGRKEKRHFAWVRPWHTSLACAGATAAVLVAAGPPAGSAWMVAALALAAGTLAGAAQARRWYLLLAGAVFSTLFGVYSSIDFLRPDVEGRFAAVAATVALHLVLGFLAGAFLEIVFFLHYLAHGRPLAEYPTGRAKGGW
jgi:hypothetical protein